MPSPDDLLRAIDLVDTQRRIQGLVAQHLDDHGGDLLPALQAYYAQTQQAVPEGLLRQVVEQMAKAKRESHPVPAKLPEAVLTRWERWSPRMERWGGRAAWMSFAVGTWMAALFLPTGRATLIGMGVAWLMGAAGLITMMAGLHLRGKYMVLLERRRAALAAFLDTCSSEALMAADRDRHLDYEVDQQVQAALVRRFGRWESQRYR